mgnify:CR=1 FL=1
MGKTEIDTYLEDVPEPQRSTLLEVRRRILLIAPSATESISYQVPTFKVDGKAIGGFAAYAKHCSYFPFSGQVLGLLKSQLEGFTGTKSSLHFPHDEPLSLELLELLIDTRLEEIRKVKR